MLQKIKSTIYDRVQGLATQLSDHLPHTPITAYGVNFLFSEDKIHEDLVDLIRLKDLDETQDIKHTITDEQCVRHLKLNGRDLNFTIKLKKALPLILIIILRFKI